MTINRHLDWDGCFNARDLGGFLTIEGRKSRWGAMVRADGLDRLTRAGWLALRAHGICTIVDLRNDSEIGSDLEQRPPEVTTVHVPLDDSGDTQFWEYVWANDLDGSPLYYRPFLKHKPERCAAVMTAISRAPMGGVAFHCGRGRDRTGLVALLLLALVGVPPDDIVSDYELSTNAVRRLDADLGEEDQASTIAETLARKKTSARILILDLLGALDVPDYLRSAGLLDSDLAAIRARFLEPIDAGETPGPC